MPELFRNNHQREETQLPAQTTGYEMLLIGIGIVIGIAIGVAGTLGALAWGAGKILG